MLVIGQTPTKHQGGRGGLLANAATASTEDSNNCLRSKRSSLRPNID